MIKSAILESRWCKWESFKRALRRSSGKTFKHFSVALQEADHVSSLAMRACAECKSGSFHQRVLWNGEKVSSVRVDSAGVCFGLLESKEKLSALGYSTKIDNANEISVMKIYCMFS